MKKTVIFFGFILFVTCISMHPAFGQSETITLTTYYPSPHGVYVELLTDRLGVGDNDGDGALNNGDIPTNTGEVWIDGNVGIGTTNPLCNLQIGEGVIAGNERPLYVFGTAAAGNNVAAFVDATTNVGISLGCPQVDDFASINAWEFANGRGANARELALNGAHAGNVIVGGAVSDGFKLRVVGGSAAVDAGQGWEIASDIRLKQNISNLDVTLTDVLSLRAIRFDTLNEESSGKGRHVGISAQELEEKFPELVTTNDAGYKSVAYGQLSMVLLEAIKAQQAQIEELKSEITRLKQK